ncbi:hypothetical protein ACJ3XI_11825 [Litorimonas sp. RW-G-Af-16]|uniref:hypothetical protein n=1 Tax=Litorimonas sp. RW-G-Af-16 TaxID=3241168 RepID=UPI00390CC65F
MTWERRRHPDLFGDLDVLLTDLTQEWDLNHGLTAKDLIEGSKPLTSKVFTERVIIADGMKVEDEHHWVRRIKRKFVQRYGHEVSVKTYSI